jgi:glycerol kinase
MDTWVIWNMTGGTDGGLHMTDVTNASRTLLMDLETLDWDDGLLDAIGVPRAMLPEIRPSSQVYGEVHSSSGASPASPSRVTSATSRRPTFGQTCFSVGRGQEHRTARATSSCSTRARRPCSPRTG